jgi:hypothetical protein
MAITKATSNAVAAAALGDLVVGTATNDSGIIPIGTTGQVLTVAAGTASWATASAGGMTLLSTTTLSGASTTVSSISQAYTNLEIIIQGMTGAGYAAVKPNGSAVISFLATQLMSTAGEVNGGVWYLAPGTANANNAARITINNYASTTYRKPISLVNGWSDGAASYGKVSSGFLQTASAITSFEITGSGDTLTGGQILIYGVK